MLVPAADGDRDAIAGGARPRPTAAGQTGAEALLTTFNLRELERFAILRALEKTGGHRLRAAELLGISDRTLRNKLNTPTD